VKERDVAFSVEDIFEQRRELFNRRKNGTLDSGFKALAESLEGVDLPQPLLTKEELDKVIQKMKEKLTVG